MSKKQSTKNLTGKRSKWVIPGQLTAVAMVLILPLILGNCSGGHEQKALVENDPETVNVRVAPVKINRESITIHATGHLASGSERRLAFKIGGVIAAITVDAGQAFRKGQVLARLQQNEIAAQVRKARENVERLDRDLQRLQRLYSDSVATLQQLQDTETALAVGRSDLQIAEFNLQHSKIIAPEAGRVLKRLAEPGEVIPAGAPLLMVGTSGAASYVLKVSLADKDVIRVNIGDSARVRFDPYRGIDFPAIVTVIGQQADPRTGVFEVELQLAATGYPLKNGFIGKAQIFPKNGPGYYEIPLGALLEADSDSATIFLADGNDGVARRVTLVPHHISSDYLLVDTTSIRLDQPLIIAGIDRLKNRQKIKIIR